MTEPFEFVAKEREGRGNSILHWKERSCQSLLQMRLLRRVQSSLLTRKGERKEPSLLVVTGATNDESMLFRPPTTMIMQLSPLSFLFWYASMNMPIPGTEQCKNLNQGVTLLALKELLLFRFFFSFLCSKPKPFEVGRKSSKSGCSSVRTLFPLFHFRTSSQA